MVVERKILGCTQGEVSGLSLRLSKLKPLKWLCSRPGPLVALLEKKRQCSIFEYFVFVFAPVLKSILCL